MKIKDVLVKTVLFCAFVMVLMPNNCSAQATSPKEGEIYYYQKQKGSEELFTKYIAVQFQDGSIKTVFGSEKNVEEFKKYVASELPSKTGINKSSKVSKDGKIKYYKNDEEEGSEEYLFSKSYEVLEYSYDDFFNSAEATYKLIR